MKNTENKKDKSATYPFIIITNYNKDFDGVKILILAKGADRHPIKGKK